MKVFLRQQASNLKHQKRLMFKHKPQLKIGFILILLLFVNGCIKPKSKQKVATLLKTDNATKTQLITRINEIAKVSSMNARIDLQFIDNSYEEFGIAEKYKNADGQIVVQRPANILLKIKVPLIKLDVAQMTSNGKRFCVAILEDGAGGKYKRFLCGTNNADYSPLQKKATEVLNTKSEKTENLKKNVNSFANLRPQHFTDAVLVRPVDTEKYIYLKSTITQEEVDVSAIKRKRKSPLNWVLRGYYLIDEIRKNSSGKMEISRRFWFDRVGGIHLARQQIFDEKGEIESDIIYGRKGNLTKTGNYKLPLRVELTRPKERYKMRITYSSPKTVKIGKTYPAAAFELKNRWKLEEVDLDQKLREVLGQGKTEGENEKGVVRDK